VAALAVLVAAGCAAPSRRLSPRQVEDPVVLPRRMASASIGGYATHYWPTGLDRADVTIPAIRLGITDRLEWTNVLSLTYAFLDDSPGGPSPGAPLSVALRAGFNGIGYSSIEGMIVQPLASIELQKHVADRWRFWMHVGWQASWASRSPPQIFSDGRTLTIGTRDSSQIGASVGVIRQLVDRLALGASVSVGQVQRCVDPFCDWVTRGVAGSLTLSFRVKHWLTLSVSPSAGVRGRPAVIPPQSPELPVEVTPQRVTWISGLGLATFYW
jgi:hypothetical protein